LRSSKALQRKVWDPGPETLRVEHFTAEAAKAAKNIRYVWSLSAWSYLSNPVGYNGCETGESSKTMATHMFPQHAPQ